MRSSLFFALAALCITANAQRLPSGARPAPVQIFHEARPAAALDHLVANATTVLVDTGLLQRIHGLRPAAFTLSVPHNGNTLLVELEQTEITVPGALVRTDKGIHTRRSEGLHYRGRVAGDAGSLAAFTFFGDRIMGIVSSTTLGDVVVAQLEDSDPAPHYVIYAAHDLRTTLSQQCGMRTDDMDPAPSHGVGAAERSEKCVRIYYELSDALYQANNADVDQTMDWLTAVHNMVATLFANEGITIALSDVFIWTTPMPFAMSEPAQHLGDLGSYRTSFNGDVAHCLTVPGANGAANLAHLCNMPYAGTNVQLAYEELPLWSFTISLIAHETGHALGSPHTHDCAWNGNNTQIDDCGNDGSLSPNYCYDPANPILIPVGEGTIMSYCAGALAAGFGPQPRQRMLDHIAASPCLGTDCITSCTPSLDSLRVQDITPFSARVTFESSDPSITNWEVRVFITGMLLLYDWHPLTTTTYEALGFTPGEWYRVEIRSSCPAPFAGGMGRYVEFQLPATECGIEVKDSGADGGYLYDCIYPPRTFVPWAPGMAVTLDFSVFSLEPDSDFFVVYNGPSADSPILAEFTGDVLPPPITSTAPGGELTVALRCDRLEYESPQGWAYTVSCAALTTHVPEAASDGPTLRPFPVPATDHLQVEYVLPTAGLVQLQLLDAQGRIVAAPAFSFRTVGLHQERIDMASLSAGVYVLRISTASGNSTARVVKR